MFKRFRSRRSSKSKHSKVQGDRSSIFRQKNNDGRLLLNPTATLDYSEVGSISTESHSAFEMDDNLCVPAIIETERAQQKRQIEDLIGAHTEEIADKDDEIARCAHALKLTESQLAEALDSVEKKDERIADLEAKLTEKETILEYTMAELLESKAALQRMGSELIQTQHVLYEKEEELSIAKSVSEFGKGIYQYFSST